MVTKQFHPPMRQHGFAMMEVAIAVLALSLMMSALLPMVTAQFKRSAAMKNAGATAAAQNALVGYALMNGGLPPPYQFKGNTDAGRASIASPTVVSTAGAAGALPYDLLGTSVSGALAIPLLYDVHPMLRRDLTYSFSVAHYTGGTAGAGTGGNMQQFCRNLNTLAAMETSVRSGATTFSTAAVLPRTWRDALTANFTTPASTSSGVAAVVVRRNPYALRRYDRENNVMATPDAGGYAKETAELRIYENPASGENEVANSSTVAYAGNVSAISYNELRDALTKAGQCGSGPAMCTNNQLYVTIQNNVQVNDGSLHGAVMQWRTPGTGSYNSLAYGQTVSQCMDAFSLNPTAVPENTLALSLSPQPIGLVEKTIGGGWIPEATTSLLNTPTKQAVVVSCGGTYSLSGSVLSPSILTCTAGN